MTLKRKKKICKRCMKERYIFADGMCETCVGIVRGWRMNRNKPLSRQKKLAMDLAKESIKERREKRGRDHSKRSYGPPFTSQREMFDWLWVHHDKVCPISKRNLSYFEGKRTYFSCFAHILPKGKYPKFKFEPDNILIVHPDVHTLIDAGTQEQRDATGWNFSPFYEKRYELLKIYQQKYGV